MSNRAGLDDDGLAIVATVRAAVAGSSGTAMAVTPPADQVVATRNAASAVAGVVSGARYATATMVAAAAAAAAEVAAETAAAAQAGTVVRASKVAAAAVDALESIIPDLLENVAPEWARTVAAAVASAVAAEVIAQTRLADDAAGRVADAVALAAEGAALAALASSNVGLAARAAGSLADEVAEPSAGADAALSVAMRLAARVTDLTARHANFLSKTPMVVELQRALDRGELQLHYQPMYDVQTDQMVAVEALLRWQHPTRGMLLPGEFLDVVEGPRLATPIGDWVLETAAKQASQWQQSFGDRAPRTWVNVSCEQLGQDHMVGVVERLLADHGLVSGSFGIEVTERQLAYRLNEVVTDLAGLRALGVPLAVDDFGTGYASMDYLRRFVFDEIKIDRSFVAGLPDRINFALISSMIALGDSLGLTVIAEGVETTEELDQLKELGCQFAQGYLFHRPATAQAVTTLLAP